MVNREEQIGVIEKALNDISQGQTVFNSVFEWYGMPGIGKTTLVQEVIDHRCYKREIPFVCIDFEPTKNFNTKGYSRHPVLILQEILNGLDCPAPEFQEALEKYKESPTRDIRDLRQKKVHKKFLTKFRELLQENTAVVAFDTTEKADPDIADWVEESIISPLVQTGKCLIIWSGRLQRRWQVFPVRRRVVSEELPPLDHKSTQKQAGDSIFDPYKFTFGHPLSSEYLIEQVRRSQAMGQQPEDKDLINAVNDIIKEYVMRDVDEDLEAACRSLSVLRQFDVTILQRILTKFVDQFFDKEDSYLRISGRLTDTALVVWNRSQQGYVLNEALRRILSKHLSLNQPQRYYDIHETAANIYREWIKKAQANSSVYIPELLYHLAHIYAASNYQNHQIIDRLQEELKNYLKSYYQGQGDNRYTAIDLTTKLYQKLVEDEELKETIGEPGYKQLVGTVNDHRINLE